MFSYLLNLIKMTSNIKFLYILSNLLISIYDSGNINIYQSEIKLVIKGSG